MADRDMGERIRWIVLAEALILLWSAAGPGYRHVMFQDGEPGVIARVFFEEPTFLQAVAVNVVGLHLFVGGVWLTVRALLRLGDRG